MNNAEGALHDRLLNALTDAVPPVRDKHKAKNALPTVYLRERWLPDHPPPRIIALCGPAGAPVSRLSIDSAKSIRNVSDTVWRPRRGRRTRTRWTVRTSTSSRCARPRWRISQRARERGEDLLGNRFGGGGKVAGKRRQRRDHAPARAPHRR